MDGNASLLGVGIYTVPEAARLLEVGTRTTQRWVNGYPSANGRFSEPVFESDHPAARARQRLLSFQDLIELFLVREFRRAGWSLQRIRAERKAAAAWFQTNHPFATRRVLTDSAYWHSEEPPLVEDNGRTHRVVQRCPSRKLVFDQFIEPFLKKLDCEGEEVSSYWPLGRDGRIVIDRARSFGKPIDNETGIPTQVLYETHVAGDSIEEVARWFHVPIESVRAAVEYEKRLRKA